MLTYPLLFTTGKGNIAQVFNIGPGRFSFEVNTEKGKGSGFTYTEAGGARSGHKNGKLNAEEQDVLNTWLSLNH